MASQVLALVSDGQPVIYHRLSDPMAEEYVRISDRYLSVTARIPGKSSIESKRASLWVPAVGEAVRSLRTIVCSPDTKHFSALIPFLRQWDEILVARGWSPLNFPALWEVVSVIHSLLYPAHWHVFLEVDGEPPEKAVPVATRETIHNIIGYDE